MLNYSSSFQQRGTFANLSTSPQMKSIKVWKM